MSWLACQFSIAGDLKGNSNMYSNLNSGSKWDPWGCKLNIFPILQVVLFLQNFSTHCFLLILFLWIVELQNSTQSHQYTSAECFALKVMSRSNVAHSSF